MSIFIYYCVTYLGRRPNSEEVNTSAGTTNIGCEFIPENTNEGMKKKSISTGDTVQKDISIENVDNYSNLYDPTNERETPVQGMNNILNQDLLCLPVSEEFEETSDSNSILDIERDVEFIDNFDFNSTDVDKLEDHVGIDWLH